MKKYFYWREVPYFDTMINTLFTICEKYLMLTPQGHNARDIEKVMLLAMWADHIRSKLANIEGNNKKFIFAGLGKPTFPINNQIIKSFKKYWEKFEVLAEKWREDMDNLQENPAIDYGNPYGDLEAKTIMAKAMTDWYESEILPENVLFTVGGIGALKTIFDSFNSLYATCGKYRVITPFPYYSAYANNSGHVLHPVEVMQSQGYQLTATALEESIKDAYKKAELDGIIPRVVLICNPSNPLGTVIKEEELKKIAKVLNCYANLHVVFDEAYVEMSFIKTPSFLAVAPELKNRTIILRSATKAFSAAGERMALLLNFDKNLMSECVNKQICSYIHPPRSGQLAYAETMLHFKDSVRQQLSEYYKSKVDYVMSRLKNMGAGMPCSNYQVESTFYALGDFSDLLGLDMPQGTEKALERRDIVKSGEDIAYYLLFKDNLMIAPLSYFGLAKNCGYLRITCSAKQSELEEMMDRLEKRLFEARLLNLKNAVDICYAVNLH